MQSTKHSWQTLFESYGIIDNYIIEISLGFILFVPYLISTNIASYIVRDDLMELINFLTDKSGEVKLAKESKISICGITFLFFIYNYHLILIYSMFQTGAKVLTFSYVLFPEKVRQDDSELADAFERGNEESRR